MNKSFNIKFFATIILQLFGISLWAQDASVLSIVENINSSKANQQIGQTVDDKIFVAQQYFENEQYENALNGDGNNVGFLEIVKEYGTTKTGKLAAYYAGICFMKLGRYEKAISYLKKYDNKDQIFSAMALGCIGDCYMELNDLQNAVSYYDRAATETFNEFTSPMFLLKKGMTCEMLGDYSSALNAYQTLRKEYPNSNEAFEISTSIAYCEKMLNSANK